MRSAGQIRRIVDARHPGDGAHRLPPQSGTDWAATSCRGGHTRASGSCSPTLARWRSRRVRGRARMVPSEAAAGVTEELRIPTIRWVPDRTRGPVSCSSVGRTTPASPPASPPLRQTVRRSGGVLTGAVTAYREDVESGITTGFASYSNAGSAVFLRGLLLGHFRLFSRSRSEPPPPPAGGEGSARSTDGDWYPAPHRSWVVPPGSLVAVSHGADPTLGRREPVGRASLA